MTRIGRAPAMLGLLGLAPWGCAPSRFVAPHVPGAGRAADVYRVTFAAEGTLDLGALRDTTVADSVAPTAIRLALLYAGELRLVALANGAGDERLVALRGVPDSVRVLAWGAGESAAAIAEQLARPLLLRAAANGGLTDLVFAPGVGAPARLLARSLLAQLSVVRPEPGTALDTLRSWEVTEAGADGWRRVRYERDTAAPGRNLALRRTVVRFLGRDSAGARGRAAALARVEVTGVQRVSVGLPRWRVDSVIGETSSRTSVLGRRIGASVARVFIGRSRTVALDAAGSRAVDSAAVALRREGMRVGLVEPPAMVHDSAAGRRRSTSNRRTPP